MAVAENGIFCLETNKIYMSAILILFIKVAEITFEKLTCIPYDHWHHKLFLLLCSLAGESDLPYPKDNYRANI